MNKNDIINTLNKYNLDKDSFIIISGAAMVLYDFKESTNDIDIAVTKDYYQKLLQYYKPKLERSFIDADDAYIIDDTINFSTNYHSSNYNIIDGYRVQSVEELINLKKLLNRNKDKKDLKLIEIKMNNFIK